MSTLWSRPREAPVGRPQNSKPRSKSNVGHVHTAAEFLLEAGWVLDMELRGWVGDTWMDYQVFLEMLPMVSNVQQRSVPTPYIPLGEKSGIQLAAWGQRGEAALQRKVGEYNWERFK